MKCNKYNTKSGKEIRLWQGDCMELMEGKPENHWDLAIVDPPYGWGEEIKGRNVSGSTSWNKKPDEAYFDQLFKTSGNRIIWGGNYFDLPAHKHFVVWDKKQPIDGFARCEFAWTNFDKTADVFEHPYFGNINSDTGRFHPTQKPIKLYRWLLTNYAEDGDTILDTHGGSMSLAISCYMEDYELDIIELDEDYYSDAVDRFEKHISQKTLF